MVNYFQVCRESSSPPWDAKPITKSEPRLSQSSTIEQSESFQSLSESPAPFNKGQTVIGLKATGHYWLALFSFLVDNGCAHHSDVPSQRASLLRRRVQLALPPLRGQNNPSVPPSGSLPAAVR